MKATRIGGIWVMVSKSGRIVHADEVAGRHADGADAAVDRRFDLGIAKLQIVGSELGLVGLDRR